MDLQEFIKRVLIDVNAAVDEVSQQTSRDITFSEKENVRTIEFDIAVSAERSDTQAGKAGIKVLEIAQAGGGRSKEIKSSTVSRITFGLRIAPITKDDSRKARLT